MPGQLFPRCILCLYMHSRPPRGGPLGTPRLLVRAAFFLHGSPPFETFAPPLLTAPDCRYYIYCLMILAPCWSPQPSGWVWTDSLFKQQRVFARIMPCSSIHPSSLEADPPKSRPPESANTTTSNSQGPCSLAYPHTLTGTRRSPLYVNKQGSTQGWGMFATLGAAGTSQTKPRPCKCA